MEASWFVALSWIVSPVTSAILSTIIFVLVRKYILRNRESLKQAFRVYPIIVAFTLALNIFLVLYKSKSLNLNMSVWLVGGDLRRGRRGAGTRPTGSRSFRT